MNALQAEASVQRVIVLNLRTEDPQHPERARRTINAMKVHRASTAACRRTTPTRRFPKLRVGLELDRQQSAQLRRRATTAASRTTASRPRVNNNGGANGLRQLHPPAARQPFRATATNPIDPAAGRQPLPAGQRTALRALELRRPQPRLSPAAAGTPVAPDPARFRSIDPVRLLDTRVGDGDASNRMIDGGRVHCAAGDQRQPPRASCRPRPPQRHPSTSPSPARGRRAS